MSFGTGFGTSTSTPAPTFAFGTTPASTATPVKPVAGFGTPSFGFSTPTTSTPSLFGTPSTQTTGFGTGTGFGTPAATGFGGTSTTGFGSASTFGSTSTNAFGTGPAFGSTPASSATTGFGTTSTFGNTPASTTGFGGFGTATTTSSLSFGNFGGFGTTTTTSAPSLFGGFGTTNTVSTGFGASTGFGTFGSKPVTTSGTPGFGGFGTGFTGFGTGLTQPQQQQQQQQQQQHNHSDHHNTHNHYVENHNPNQSQQSVGNLVVDVETNHENKKHRTGPCVIRSGTREVHNKLEKNRRAHLKECFELLKKQLPLQDEKKSSNLSILHAANKYIRTLTKKDQDYEHEMERLAREKIAAQQKLMALKKELNATWDHIDINSLLLEQNSVTDMTTAKNESIEVDVAGLPRGGTRYSSTSSLNSVTTASSPQTLQSTSTTSNMHNQAANSGAVCQTQDINLARSSRESPPANSMPSAAPTSSISAPQEKVATSTASIVQQSHQLHLPISAQMLNTSQGLATIVPTLQHIGPGLRVVPSDTRQLLVAHTTGNNEPRSLTLAVQNSADQSRPPLIAVQSNAGNEPRPVALVVHSSTANDNRVTFVHSNLSNNDRPLALAMQSSASDVRPVTFVHSGNEGRPLVLATHSPALNVSNTQTRIRTGDAQTTHKMVSGVTLVGGNGSELARLPGGAELNILPANGLTLSHAGVSLQTTAGKSGSTMMQNASSTESIAHIVGQHTPLSGLTPIVTPMTVVSQGNQVTAHILAPSSLAGKMITTPILKSVGQMPLVNAQYLNTTTLVKPVVVVSSSTSTLPSTTASSTQPPSTSNSTV